MPSYMTLEYHIHNGSCFDLAPLLTECHALICDPPYSKKVHIKATSNGMLDGNSLGVRKRDMGFGWLTYKLRAFIAQATTRVLGWSVIYSDAESTNLWRIACEARGAEYIRTIPWVRWSQPQMSGDRPCTGCEMITVYWPRAKTKKRWNGPGSFIALDHEDPPEIPALTHKSLRGEDKHKAEKPLDQMLDLVSWFSSPGQTVVDLTAGAGTTGVACALLGRSFLGAEIDVEVANFAIERIHAARDASLTGRDQERVARWCEATLTEASAVPYPKNKSQEKTYARAQRRLADLDMVASWFL